MAELETQLDPLKLFVCRDNAEAEAGEVACCPPAWGGCYSQQRCGLNRWWCSIVPPVSCGDHVISVQPLDAITIDQSAPACGGRVLVQIYGTTLRSDGL